MIYIPDFILDSNIAFLVTGNSLIYKGGMYKINKADNKGIYVTPTSDTDEALVELLLGVLVDG